MRTVKPRTSKRPAGRSFRPTLARLEPRELPATTVSTLLATPAILNPPNNRFVSVTISGNVIESSPKGTPHALYQVTDEYRRYEPGGKVALTKVTPTVYAFTFSVVLKARRAQTDLNGRHYFIEVGSQDTQSAGGLTVGVLVPHDKLKPGQMLKPSTVQIRIQHKHHK